MCLEKDPFGGALLLQTVLQARIYLHNIRIVEITGLEAQRLVIQLAETK